MRLITGICTDTNERELNKGLHNSFHPLCAKQASGGKARDAGWRVTLSALFKKDKTFK